MSRDDQGSERARYTELAEATSPNWRTLSHATLVSLAKCHTQDAELLDDVGADAGVGDILRHLRSQVTHLQTENQELRKALTGKAQLRISDV